MIKNQLKQNFSEVIILIVISATFLSFSFFLKTTRAENIECFCTFDNKPLLSAGKNLRKCMELCGKMVGGQSDCEENCGSCCDEWCSKIDEKISRINCVDSCIKSCEFKEFMNQFISLFYVLSGVIAAIMFVIHGLRLMTSDDAKKREVSKKAIMYVILALIIIGVGGMLMSALLKGIVKPETARSVGRVEGCGGVILNANEEINGENIRIEVKFMNNGNEGCMMYLELYNAENEPITEISEITPFYVLPNEIKTIDLEASLTELNGAYTLKLFSYEEILPIVLDTLGPIDILLE